MNDRLKARGLFVAGTDTNVGKTVVATALVRGLVAEGLKVAVMKPVAAGAYEPPEGLRNEDALALLRAANVQMPYEVVNPYCFAPAVSPHIAAREAGVVIDIGVIRRRYEELASEADYVVVESAGGWFAPIGATQTMEDIAKTLGLPVLLVVGLKLGCLNHAILTAKAIAASGLPLLGWVGNQTEFHFEHQAENVATLETRLGSPALDVVGFEFVRPNGIQLSAEAIARVREGLGE